MKDLLKKSFLLGLGAASLTRKKVQKIVEPLIKQGLITRKDGLKLIKKALAEGGREKKRIEKLIFAEMKKAKPLVRKAGSKVKRKAKRLVKKAGSKAKKRAKGIAKRVLRKVR